MNLRLLPIALMLLAACKDKTEETGDDTATTPGTDADGDGYSLDADCDDTDPAVHANAEEVCDGKDNDCDDGVDEDLAVSNWYADVDGDGYGSDTAPVESCAQPEGYVAQGGDCADADTAYHPGATEDDCTDPNDYNCDGSVGAVDSDQDGYFACQECDDGNAAVNPIAAELCNDIDDNCDNVTDTDAVDAGTWYTDTDSDGYGDDNSAVTTCDQPAGTSALAGDCDDSLATFNPAATEDDCSDPNDYNCDGSTGYADADGDGFAACLECDDANAAVNSAATEMCDTIDNNCDGTVDEGTAADATVFYADADSDTFGDPASGVTACAAPSSYVSNPDDCDDTDSAYNPGATEECFDTADYNCDGSVGYADGDADGFAACLDCDDTNPGANSAATEVCDGVDNNCDGTADEASAVGAPTWYADVDGDGYGDDGAVIVACAQPDGFVVAGGDCDDTDAAFNPGIVEDDCTDPVDYNCDGSAQRVDADADGFAACEECDDSSAANYPGATEVCDGFDNDCDAAADEAGAEGESTWYTDADSDGYGDDATATIACFAPSGAVPLGGDCDDGSPLYNPSVEEDCADSEDFNCDGSVTYDDSDGDGYAACVECDDGNADIFPGSTEICDDVDNDCDGNVDESGATGESSWYADSDGDTFGDADTSVVSCNAPTGFVADKDDCDDSSNASNPNGLEVCDLLDNDCDGTVDDNASDASTWYEDGDGDGYGYAGGDSVACGQPAGSVANDADCDDTLAEVSPSASETCNDRDDDCDGTADDNAMDQDTFYADTDGDGFGNASVFSMACDTPDGFTSDDTDCNDSDAFTNPEAIETCDLADNNCDGTVDEDTAVDADTWYADEDDDGYGASDTFTIACDAPEGYGSDATDCDDTDGTVNPAATEVCDGIDNDCIAGVDAGATDATTWYADWDSDGFGGVSLTACDMPEGFISTGGDCDDTEGDIYPGAVEYCNGDDDDCDGDTDGDAVDLATWYLDTDGDGYGVDGSTTTACDVPTGYASNSGDCDDTEITVRPGLPEVCDDFLDNDCDGTANTCEIGGSLVVTNADWLLAGAAANDYLGSSVAGGDLNDDGYSDIAIGAYGWDSSNSSSVNTGRVYIYNGALTGPDTVATADTIISGTESNEQVGFTTSFLGDINGDGLGDLAIGSTKRNNGSTSDTGAAYLFTTIASGSVDITSAQSTILSTGANDQTAIAISGNGDVDGDDLMDVLVGANLSDSVATDAGVAGLFYGSVATGSLDLAAADVYFRGVAASDGLGFSAGLDGDLDGDGLSDVALGAYLTNIVGTDSGSVYVFSGGLADGTYSAADADTILNGAASGDNFGRSLAMLGDSDGDGRDDLAVGADRADNGSTADVGTVFVFTSLPSGTATAAYGTNAAATYTGVTASDFAGRVVGSPGDTNADGYADLLLSATGYDNGSVAGTGASYLLYGPLAGANSLSTYDARIRGSASNDAAGYAADGVGDVDDDGFDDFLMGAISADNGSTTNVGGSWLFYGGGL